jgi:RNA polymerase sigma factor (sigma-70 family)
MAQDADSRQESGGALPETTLRVRKALDGDEESLGWIIGHFHPLLVLQAGRRLPADLLPGISALDLAEQVWLVFLGKPRRRELKLRPREGRFTPVLLRYLSTILLNLLRDRLRALKPSATLPSAAEDGSGVCEPVDDRARGVTSEILARERSDAVLRALQGLPPGTREILILRGVEGQAHKDIARELGITEENARVRYKRAIQELRGLLPQSLLDEISDA